VPLEDVIWLHEFMSSGADEPMPFYN
jgi:hypothetical protein